MPWGVGALVTQIHGGRHVCTCPRLGRTWYIFFVLLSVFPQLQDEGGAEGLEGLRLKHFRSFRAYAEEQAAHGNTSLPIPFVTSPEGPEASRSIPLATIIGVQASGGNSGSLGFPYSSGIAHTNERSIVFGAITRTGRGFPTECLADL